jgi:hypothetical protein
MEHYAFSESAYRSLLALMQGCNEELKVLQARSGSRKTNLYGALPTPNITTPAEIAHLMRILHDAHPVWQGQGGCPHLARATQRYQDWQRFRARQGLAEINPISEKSLQRAFPHLQKAAPSTAGGGTVRVGITERCRLASLVCYMVWGVDLATARKGPSQAAHIGCSSSGMGAEARPSVRPLPLGARLSRLVVGILGKRLRGKPAQKRA